MKTQFIPTNGIGEGISIPTQAKINAPGAEMEAIGQPTTEQIAKMNSLQSFLIKAYHADIIILTVAVGSMAVARYL